MTTQNSNRKQYFNYGSDPEHYFNNGGGDPEHYFNNGGGGDGSDDDGPDQYYNNGGGDGSDDGPDQYYFNNGGSDPEHFNNGGGDGSDNAPDQYFNHGGGGSSDDAPAGGCDQAITVGAAAPVLHQEEHYINGIREKEYFDSLPSGYRFEPHDQELILDYLKKRINDEKMPMNKIKLVKLYEQAPYDLTARFPELGENTWYFFTPRDRKYQNGSRPNRAAGNGYWKATGKDKVIQMYGDHGGPVVGYRKSLVFYDGKPKDSTAKTNWSMHEYRVSEPSKRVRTSMADMRLDDYVLCKILRKSLKERVGDGGRVGVDQTTTISNDGNDGAGGGVGFGFGVGVDQTTNISNDGNDGAGGGVGFGFGVGVDQTTNISNDGNDGAGTSSNNCEEEHNHNMHYHDQMGVDSNWQQQQQQQLMINNSSPEEEGKIQVTPPPPPPPQPPMDYYPPQPPMSYYTPQPPPMNYYPPPSSSYQVPFQQPQPMMMMNDARTMAAAGNEGFPLKGESLDYYSEYMDSYYWDIQNNLYSCPPPQLNNIFQPMPAVPNP